MEHRSSRYANDARRASESLKSTNIALDAAQSWAVTENTRIAAWCGAAGGCRLILLALEAGGEAEFMTERKTRELAATEIERRAYELFLERGGEDGHDVDDWMRAERELGTQVGTQAEPRRTVERSGERGSSSDSQNGSIGKRL
jgi:hypothetical protein